MLKSLLFRLLSLLGNHSQNINVEKIVVIVINKDH